MSSQYPQSFPVNCPPADAIAEEAVVFRVVKQLMPCDSDFMSYAEEGKLPSSPACRRCAISVYNSFDGAAHRARVSPALGGFISRGQLTAQAGASKLTDPDSGHVAWWPIAGVDGRSFFETATPCP